MATQYTIEALTDPRFNDVVLWEEIIGPGIPHSRDVVSLSASITATLKQGTVLWRVKAKTATATWDVVNDDTDVNVANEYAILIGDDRKTSDTVAVSSGVAKNVIALTRRAHVKDKTIRDITTGFGVTTTEFNNLKRLLATQGVIVSDTLTAIPA